MSSLTQFTNAPAIPPTPATIEYQGTEYKFLIKTLTAGEFESVTEKAFGVGRKGTKKTSESAANYRSRMISQTILDEDGTDRFSLKIVMGWPNKLSNLVFKEVQKVNDMIEDVEDEDEDDAGKSSPETAGSD